MRHDSTIEMFDEIYSTDLVYKNNCWRLCGNAHCCNFSRYKDQFNLIGGRPYQELPLLPGEYEYLQRRGWLTQFGDFDHKVIEYPLDGHMMIVESIVSRRPQCACDHDTRPTVCRLYPLLPVFDIKGRLEGVDTFGIYEELEKIDELEPACKLTSMPFGELEKFLAICREIGRCPKCLYYMTAYRIAKQHVSARVREAKVVSEGNSLGIFERMLIRKQLVNHNELKSELTDLADRFSKRYGRGFMLE